MGKNRFDSFRTLFLYFGSKDERTQRLIDRAGNYCGIFLFIGILADIFVKSLVFKQSLEHYLIEIVILLMSGIYSIFLYVRYGITILENPRQKRTVRVSLIMLSIIVAPVSLYMPLLLKLPSARRTLDFGLVAWLIPIPFSIVWGILVWLLVKLVDFLAKKKSRRLEGSE